jgi:excinuclease UvrABC ATPase subunit
MSVAEALEFLGGGAARTPAAHRTLARLVDVGLVYLTVGQRRSRRCPAANGNA